MSKEKKCYIIASSSDFPLDIRNNENIELVNTPDQNAFTNTLAFTLLSTIKLLKIIYKYGSSIEWVGSFSANAGFSIALLSPFIDTKIFCVRRGANLRRLKIRLREDMNRNALSHIKGLLKIFIHKLISKAIFASSDLLISQTESGIRQLENEYDDWLPSRRAVLRNNVDATWIVRRRNCAVNDPIKLRCDVFNVCYVGRMQLLVKGVDSLLNAAEKLKKDDICFHLVGDGKDMKKIHDHILSKSLKNSVNLYGWMDNPLKIMVESDLLVVPSRVDPCPNVVLEAFAVGTPVIGSNTGGIKAMLHYDDLLFNPGSPKEISKMIRDIATDREVYDDISSKCVDLKDKHCFDWGGNLTKVFREYKYHTGIYKPIDI